MKNLIKKLQPLLYAVPLFLLSALGTSAQVDAQVDTPIPSTVQMGLEWKIPSLIFLLTFAVRAFFTIAALIALVFLILGAFSWITSSGEKEAVKKAQDKIQAALLGLIVIAAVLAVAVTLETIVFNKKVCFGLTCEIQIPTLLEPK